VCQEKLYAAALDDRGPIEWRERTEGFIYSSEAVSSIASNEKKRASDIHPSLFHSNGRSGRSQITCVEGGDGDRYVSTAMLVVQKGHFHHPLFRPFWRPFVPRLLALGALFCSCEQKALCMGVRLCSSEIAAEAVNEAVTFGHRGSCPNAPPERSCHGQKSNLCVILSRLDPASKSLRCALIATTSRQDLWHFPMAPIKTETGNRIFGKRLLLHNKTETRAVASGSEAF
jgi:hypothetical protein